MAVALLYINGKFGNMDGYYKDELCTSGDLKLHLVVFKVPHGGSSQVVSTWKFIVALGCCWSCKRPERAGASGARLASNG